MAGHSKWANIRFRKGLQDARRGKLFTKLIREITVAARLGGGDPAANPRLRLAIDRALSHNMPKDNIERAIQRGTGQLEGAHYEEARFEGYGPGGVAILVDCATDNRTRTVGELRHTFSKHGGKLGTEGSVAYLFKRLGVLSYPPGADEDAIVGAALEAGAQDVVTDTDGSVEVLTAPEDLPRVHEAMTQAGLKPENARITERALTTVALDEETAGKVLKLLDALEELDDVQQVYSNADFPEAALAREAAA